MWFKQVIFELDSIIGLLAKPVCLPLNKLSLFVFLNQIEYFEIVDCWREMFACYCSTFAANKYDIEASKWSNRHTGNNGTHWFHWLQRLLEYGVGLSKFTIQTSGKQARFSGRKHQKAYILRILLRKSDTSFQDFILFKLVWSQDLTMVQRCHVQLCGKIVSVLFYFKKWPPFFDTIFSFFVRF